MAKETHIVEESIVFKTSGQREALKDIRSLEDALGKLEKTRLDSSSISKKT